MAPKVFNLKLFHFRSVSLRNSLIAFMLVGAGSGLTGRWVQSIRDRGDAQLRLAKQSSKAFVRRAALEIQYTSVDQPTWTTSLVRKYVHPEYRRTIQSIALRDESIDIALANDIANVFAVDSMDVFCDSLSPESAKKLFSVRGLTQLHIASRKFYGEAWPSDVLEHLKDAPTLRTLSTSFVFSPDAYEELCKLPKLRELHLTACTPEGLVIIANHKKLQSLTIGLLRDSTAYYYGPDGKAEIFDERARQALKESLQKFSQNPNLCHLSIKGGLDLSGVELTEFHQLSSLKSLTLESQNIMQNDLERLARLPNLESLTIHDIGIGDQHLPPIASASNLKQLTLGPKVSVDAVCALRKQLPNCKIERH